MSEITQKVGWLMTVNVFELNYVTITLVRVLEVGDQVNIVSSTVFIPKQLNTRK